MSDDLWDEFDALAATSPSETELARFVASLKDQVEVYAVSISARLDQIEAARRQYTATTKET